MKHITKFTLVTFIICITLGCRISKQKNEKLSNYSRGEENIRQFSDRFLWQQIDSSQSYWILQTDSLLYYHPQWGVWSKGGQLLGGQIEIQKSSILVESDSLERQTQMESKLDSRFNRAWSIQENWTGIIGLAVVVFVVLVLVFRAKML